METKTGFLITQIKQVQGRVFQRLLDDCGVNAFNGAQGHILYVLWQEDRVPVAALAKSTAWQRTPLRRCWPAWRPRVWSPGPPATGTTARC